MLSRGNYREKTKIYQFTCDESETNEQAALGHQTSVRMGIVKENLGKTSHDDANGNLVKFYLSIVVWRDRTYQWVLHICPVNTSYGYKV